MNLSERGIERIIYWETGGRAEYDQHPEWPGVESGVTIGIGWGKHRQRRRVEHGRRICQPRLSLRLLQSLAEKAKTLKRFCHMSGI